MIFCVLDLIQILCLQKKKKKERKKERKKCNRVVIAKQNAACGQFRYKEKSKLMRKGLAV